MTDAQPAIEFQILGPLTATAADGERLRFASATQRRLLTALLLNANSVVSSDRLSEWCDLSAGGLRTSISRLRNIVGADIIFLEPPGYVLRTKTLDSHEFERLVERSRTANSRDALALLDAALALWNGDALADFADEPWARAAAISLSELRTSAIEDRAEVLLELGRYADALVAMEFHIPHYPLRDRPRGLLMRALAADGRQPEALRSYQAYRDYLIDEIGTEPTDEIRALEARIATGWRERSAAFPRNLGVQTTTFVGRQTEVKEVSDLVRQHRLVTLTGVGGVGKTRLAIQVATELAPEFEDGVWLVELGPVGDPRSVPDAVASALGVTAQPGLPVSAHVADALASRNLLVILDNCEHVIDACASLMKEILQASTTVSLIATSREGTRVRGEHLWPVPPLGIDDGIHSAAVKLFVERAQQVNPAFRLVTDEASAAVVEICRRLDGIALAIELAAARMVSMTPIEVSGRLNDRFRLLSGSPHGLERHQTLRQAVQWSYDLLTADEQMLLGVCAVFAGGFDLHAATAVGEQFDEYEIVDGLDSLVRKSLVARQQIDGRSRYSVLETIGHFAEDHFATSNDDTSGIDQVRDRHAQYFADKAVEQFSVWDGPSMSDAAIWLEAEFDNLRAALRWATEHDNVAAAAAIAAHTPMIAFGLQQLEPVSWAEELLPSAHANQIVHLPRLYTAASLCSYLGRHGDALRYAQSAAALQTDAAFEPFNAAWVSFREAVAQLDGGHPERYLEICGELACEPGLAHVVGSCGLVALLPSVGRADEARAIADDALASATAYASPYWIAFAHVGYSRAFADTDPALAMDTLGKGLDYARAHPIPYWEAVLAREAGGLEAVHGDPAHALELLSTSLDSFHQAGNTATLAWILASLAVVFDRTGHSQAAATIVGTTRRDRIDDLILGFAPAVDNLRQVLGAETFDQLEAQGVAMDVSEAVHYAHTQIDHTRRQLKR